MAICLGELLQQFKACGIPDDALVYVDDGGLTVCCAVNGEEIFGYEIGGWSGAEKNDTTPSTLKPPDVMVKINGETFRCECGCNVFRKPMYKERPELYECNGCGDLYESSKFDTPEAT